MKNKLIVSSILLLLVSITSADTLSYDNESFFGGLLVNEDYSARVRFTSTVDGALSQVGLHWHDLQQCCVSGARFSLKVHGNYTGSTVSTGGFQVDCSGWQWVSVSDFFPVVAGEDFYVEVRRSGDSVSHLCLSMSVDDSSVNRSEQYGFFPGEWVSVDIVLPAAGWPSCELGVRAVVSPSDVCRWMGEGCVGSCGEGFSCVLVGPESCECQRVSPPTTRPPSNGGGGGYYSTGGVGRNCFDDIMNCHHGDCESGVDCGGPCDPCMNCSDGVQNQGELGVDCGGPCPPCPTTTTTSVSTTTSMVPVVVFPEDCGVGCSRIPSPGNPFSDCVSCMDSLDCSSLCGVAGVCDVAEYCFSSGDGSFCGCCCRATSTTFIPSGVTGRVTGYPLDGVSLFLFFFFLLLLGFGVYRYFRGGS